MFEGKKINLRMAEKEGVPLFALWLYSSNFVSDYQHFHEQIAHAKLEKQIVERKNFENE